MRGRREQISAAFAFKIAMMSRVKVDQVKVKRFVTNAACFCFNHYDENTA
jgi:hypothetical protein